MPEVWNEFRKRKFGRATVVRWRARRFDGARDSGSETFRHRDSADDFRVKKRKRLKEWEAGLVASPQLPVTPMRTVQELAAAYLEHSKREVKPSTFERFHKVAAESFKAAHAGVHLQDLTPKHIADWKGRLFEQGLGATTVSMYERNVRTMLNYGVAMKWLEASPAKGLRAAKAKTPGQEIPDEHITRLLAGATILLQQGIVASLYMGPRISDLTERFTWPRVLGRDSDPQWIWNIGRTRKTGEPCLVPIPAEVRRMMGQRREEGPVFGFTMGGLQSGFHDRCVGLGFKYRWHDLRHTFATRFLRSGGSKSDLVDAGLWADERSLDGYIHLDVEYLVRKWGGLQYPTVPPPKAKPRGPDRRPRG